MKPTIQPTAATLGAIVTDVDLADLSDSSWRAIETAFHEFAVLIFPQQHLEPDEQVSFGVRFGEIELLTPDENLKALPLSNLKRDGSVASQEEHFSRVLKGNEEWHTDSSYMPLAARASILSARVTPREGGQTQWADMRAAYDALDAKTRERLSKLAAYHSLYFSQARMGHSVEPGTSYGFHSDGAPLRPLVKEHPKTRRKALYIGRHAHDIPGLSKEESESLLGDLLEFGCSEPRTWQHDWEPGDIAIWDNRCVLHRAQPYDYQQPRVMLHTRIAGDPATELAETAPERR